MKICNLFNGQSDVLGKLRLLKEKHRDKRKEAQALLDEFVSKYSEIKSRDIFTKHINGTLFASEEYFSLKDGKIYVKHFDRGRDAIFEEYGEDFFEIKNQNDACFWDCIEAIIYSLNKEAEKSRKALSKAEYLLFTLRQVTK